MNKLYKHTRNTKFYRSPFKFCSHKILKYTFLKVRFLIFYNIFSTSKNELTWLKKSLIFVNYNIELFINI